jgi:predicted nucleic acid-binding protein
MTWARAVILMLQALTGLVAFLRERKLLAAGEAQAVAAAFEAADERVQAALIAREAARRRDPDADDPYRRD